MQAITELNGNADAESQSQVRTIKKKISTSKPEIVQPIKAVDLTDTVLSNYSKHTSDAERLYFYQRGLPDCIINAYKLFKCDPREVFDKELLPKLSNISDWEYIIPIWRAGKAVNAILRRNDEKTTYGEKTYNLRSLGLEIINTGHVAGGHKLVCITEGVWDAYTLETMGLLAISLNSVNMANRLIKQIEISNNKSTKYFLFGDNDEKGQQLNVKLAEAFDGMGITYKVFDRYENYKDVNEFYVAEPQRLKQNVKECWTGRDRNGYNG